VQSKIAEAIRYTLSNSKFLNNYLQDGQIEIGNNLFENAIRLFALGRKNWFFNCSPNGVKTGEIFYSLIEACEANNIEPYKNFCVLLNHIRSCNMEDEYPNLLPHFINLY
jgi:transposase